jgi:hypothetical protein
MGEAAHVPTDAKGSWNETQGLRIAHVATREDGRPSRAARLCTTGGLPEPSLSRSVG